VKKNREGINYRLKKIISQILKIGLNEVDEGLHIDNNPNWDSLKHLKLIIALENEFDITIDSEDISRMLDFKSINKIVSLYEDSKHDIL
jgi:acyl carrier protein